MQRLPLIAVALGLILATPVAQAQPEKGSAAAAPDQKTAHQARKAATAAKKPVRRATARRRAATTTARPKATTTARKTTKNVNNTVTRNVRKTVDITKYRKVVQAPRRYRIAKAWSPPRGFAYRRFGLGERIPSALLVADFFLTGFSSYGLEAPPYGYVWVRDGVDAVLVNQATGEVIQVQYGLFY